MKKLIAFFRRQSFRRKLISIFTAFAFVILMLNTLIYAGFASLLTRLGDVYESNMQLNDMDATISLLQNSIDDYVRTKSFESLENYYNYDKELREEAQLLNDVPSDDVLLLAEKNIRNLCNAYLQKAEETVDAKRGRNVELYAELSEETAKLGEEIHTYIYSLNNDLFKSNSETYMTVSSAIGRLETVSVIVLLLTIGGSIMILSTSTAALIRPLNRLAGAANEVADGNLDIETLPVYTKDEVGVVTNAFNQMVGNIRQYIAVQRENMERENALKENELRMQNHLREAQLKYLQAQINPHFLFNTLNAGAQLAMMEEAKKTGELLTNTAAFFRYNVRNSEDATIGEEVRLVDNYIYICNVRFPDEIHFEKDVDESLEDMKVPSMILQPLVENAFNYGIRNLERRGMIELEIKRVDERIQISVWDNGRGISAERIDEILHAKKPQPDPRSTSSNGVGIRNLLERLRLYFDNDVAFNIISEGEEAGTEILISIPCLKE